MLALMATDELAAAGKPPQSKNLGTALKGIAALHAVLVLVLAVLAGTFLAGDDAAIRLHQVIGTSVLYPVAIGQAILGTVLWRRKQLSVGYPLLCLVVVLTEGAQIGLGFTGQVAVHVPLGVALFGATTALVLMSHRPAEPAREDAGGEEQAEPSR